MYEVKLDSVQVLLICWPHNICIWFKIFVDTENVLSQNTTEPLSGDGMLDTATGFPSISTQTFSCENEVEVCTRFDPPLLLSETLVKMEHSCVCIMIRSSVLDVLMVPLNRTISELLVPAAVIITGVVSRFDPTTPRSEIAIAAIPAPDAMTEVFADLGFIIISISGNN